MNENNITTLEEVGAVGPTTQSTFDIRRFDTAERASAAIPSLLARGGQLVEGLLSKTSGRWQFATTSLLEMLVEISEAVVVDKAKLKLGEGTDSQRPVDPPHVKEIAEYFRERVEEGKPYWFGQLAFNIKSDQTVIIVSQTDDAPIQQAYMVVPKATKMLPVDGNHRLSAFQLLMEAAKAGQPTWDALKGDAIQWCLIDEPDPDIARQLFVDAGKAKQLPPALLVGFAALDVFPSVVKRVAIESPVFKGRIDYLSKSLGRDHRVIMTVNQLRIVIAEFLFGRSDRKGLIQETTALAGEVAQDAAVDDAVEFFSDLASALGGPWQEVLEGKPQMLADLREVRVDFTTSGLQALARAGHELRHMDRNERRERLARLRDLNYTRSNQMWIECGLVIPTQTEAGTTYRIATQAANVTNAYEAIKEVILGD